MNKFWKILQVIIDILKVYFNYKNNVDNNKELDSLNKDLDSARDVIESRDDDKLNEILR